MNLACIHKCSCWQLSPFTKPYKNQLIVCNKEKPIDNGGKTMAHPGEGEEERGRKRGEEGILLATTIILVLYCKALTTAV